MGHPFRVMHALPATLDNAHVLPQCIHVGPRTIRLDDDVYAR